MNVMGWIKQINAALPEFKAIDVKKKI